MCPIMILPAQNKTYPPQVLADNPYAYWRMEESAGPTMVDSSGNGRDGTWVSAPTFSQTPLITSGASALFNGTSNYATVVQAASEYTPAQWAVEAWIETNDMSVKRTIMHTGDFSVGGNRGWALNVRSDGAIQIEYWNGASFVATNSASSTIMLNTTYHVVANVINGTSTRILVNNVEVANDAHGNTFEGGVAQPVKIGVVKSTVLTQWWSGRLDEIAFYDAILPDVRIAAHYNAGI